MGAHPHNSPRRFYWVLIMALEPFARLDAALYPADTDVEPGASAVAWSAIWAGATTAIALTLILLTIGSGFGLASVSPWPGVGPRPSTFSVEAGIWLIVTQWLSSGVGGYIAGRMRTRWTGLHTHEVFFRDTAHGLVTWSVATIIVTAVAVAATALTALGAPPAEPAVTATAADEARKVAAAISIFTGISMLIGAFISSVAAAIGGRLRDKHP